MNPESSRLIYLFHLVFTGKPSSKWKPLAGPLRDYLMVYCDVKTMDPETDLLVVDEVFPTVANEVYQVLHNENRRW